MGTTYWIAERKKNPLKTRAQLLLLLLRLGGVASFFFWIIITIPARASHPHVLGGCSDRNALSKKKETDN